MPTPVMARAASEFSLATIFLDVRLPNNATWFYLSLLLAVALFFKFSRVLSVRNWDVVTLFLLVPGLLLLTEDRTNWYGYLWLLAGSAYLILRCLFDLTLVRRPALSPNLSQGGLIWLACGLFVMLVAFAFRPADEQPQQPSKVSALLDHTAKEVEKGAKEVIEQQPGLNGTAAVNVEFWVGRILALSCHLLVAGGLVFVAWRHFQDLPGGVAAATFYLLLPYTVFHAAFAHHVWPLALIVWAVALYQRPTLAGLLLGLAAGTAYFPALIFPVWCGFYGRRGAGRFAAAFVLAAGLSLGSLGVILWGTGELPGILQAVLSLADWQPWIQPAPDTPGFWTAVQWAWAYRIPVFIAYLAFLVTTVFWPSPKNLGHLLALSAALLIGIQFWYAKQGGIYVSWYLPLLLLMMFRPNLNDRRPPPIQRETDWLLRFGRWLKGGVLRLLRRLWPARDPVAQ